MKHRKGSTLPKKVWRMTDAVPQGEVVEVGATPAAAAAARAAATAAAVAAAGRPEVSHGSWLESSFELLSGTEINDGPDTVPDDLFDELFAPAGVTPGPSGK